MTVRAVDMQTMLPRLTEASRGQQQLAQQAAMVQHTQTAQGHARAERAQAQVNQKSPAEQASVHKDGGKGAGGGGQPRERGARQKAEEPKKAGAPDSGLGHRLDIKV